ncbi:unnamed protein product [Ixodes persulcatus]
MRLYQCKGCNWQVCSFMPSILVLHTPCIWLVVRDKEEKKTDKVPQCSPTNARGIYSQFYISSFFSTSIAE